MKVKSLVFLLNVVLAIQCFATDTDSDGMTDDYETSQGYNPNLYTKVIYVDNAKADDTGDGLSLATAKKTISAAIALKDTNLENVILVAAGTYTGSSNKNLSFGGCDIIMRATGGAATTIIDLENSGNFLALTNGETLASLLDGFTIKNGLTNDGGALYINEAGMTIKNCNFENNTGTSYSGALSIIESHIDVDNCKFIKNYSSWGGGIAFRKATANITNSEFTGNGSDDASAIVIYDCNGTFNINKCKFIRNYTTGNEGTLYIFPASSTTTVNVTNSLFLNNRAYTNTDIYSDSGSTVYLNIKNTTMTRSKHNADRVCYFKSYTTTTIENCIIKGTIIADGSLIANNTNCLNDLSSHGTGNTTVDPQLTADGHLKSTSPCINAGTSTGAPADDINGTSRPVGGSVDMGCYEFNDTDSDGMDDAWETAYFGDLTQTATGDNDSDQLNNLDEYLYGTAPDSADTDGDGVNDKTEIDNHYNPLLPLRTIYVDAAQADDSGDGLTPANAKKSISAAISLVLNALYDNEVLVAAGTYSGSANRGIDVMGFDTRLRSSAGAATTIIDLQNSDYFIFMYNPGVIDGFTICNGNSSYSGAAIYAEESEYVIKNCIFEYNYSSDSGGALYFDEAVATVENCEFNANVSPCGGAVDIWASKSIKIKNCSFIGNECTVYDGGAIYVDTSGTEIEIDKCVFADNESADDGGAIDMISHDNNSDLRITNSLFYGNSAVDEDADIRTNGTTYLYVTNCTMIRDVTSDMVCFMKSSVASGTFINNILIGKISRYCTLYADYNCSPYYDLSSYGTGNISSDPLLDANYCLTSTSPCIDIGTSTGAPEYDLAGNTRPQGPGIDMGCYEYLVAIVDTDADGMDDDWETQNFGDLSQTADGDYDNDGVSNLDEYLHGTNPTVFADADADGMSDDWETAYMGNTSRDGTGDYDSDGVSDLTEYQKGTDPDNVDSDSDGINDNVEISSGYDPTKYTKIIYVDASKADDTGDGLCLANAKKSINSAISISKDSDKENVILVVAGVYNGINNRNIDFGGYDIKLQSISGATTTIVDLEQSGRFLYLHNNESLNSWIDGFTIINGKEEYGGVIYLDHAKLTIKNSLFQNNQSSCGGVINGYYSNFNIYNCRFVNNKSTLDGGGVISVRDSSFLVKECDFIGNASLSSGGCIDLETSELNVESCRLISNYSGFYGGAISCYSSDINLTNCLIQKNRSQSGYNAIYLFGGSEATIVNSTIWDNNQSKKSDIHISGVLNVVNSIFMVKIVGTPTSVTNCCTSTDLSSHGSGNFVADPQLNGTGNLLSTSPCIDAGTTTGAPSEDIDGVTRPVGTGIDIGCYEFKDTDSDGIPDNIEIAAGLNQNNASDGAGDKDGDGISNLNEYKAGSDLNNVDSDGDGINDNTEISLGYNSIVYTRVIYVDASKADDTGDGLSLVNAKKTIKAAVTISQYAGYENVIMVAAGTYSGSNNHDIDFNGYDIKLRSISGAATTIIDLEQAGQFLLLQKGESLKSWLEGFTVKNGSTGNGGVIRLIAAGLTLKDNVFKNNNADFGGVIDGSEADINITNCKFTNNGATTNGGAIYLIESNITMNSCDLIGNEANNSGAIEGNEINLSISDCKFADNNSDDDGGAISLTNSSVTMTCCDFTQNMSRNSGGAIRIDSSTLTAEKSRFYSNCSETSNGVLFGENSSIDLVNCLVYSNKTKDGYGVIGAGESSEVNIVNSTIYGNHTPVKTDVYVDGVLNVTNSVFQANTELEPTSVTNCCTSTDLSSHGSGNFVADPQLNGAGNLLSTSPCIDAGTTTGAPSEDIDGVTRPVGTGIDIGCYEFKDTDSDGIPDNIEIAAGLNQNNASDGAGDKDGDGISNLNEYKAGSDLNNVDSDGDGINDNTEISLGYNSIVYTRVIYVDASKADDTGDGLSLVNAKKTIKAAVTISQYNGYENVIMVAAGTYSGSNNRDIDFNGYDIKLRSISGAATTIIDLEQAGRFLYLHNNETANSWVDGFTIKNGSINEGGVIFTDYAMLTIKNNIFENNSASSHGGGIEGNQTTLAISNCKFLNNSASQYGGAIYLCDSSCSISNCDFTGNTASLGGALMLTGSNISVSKCKILNNLSQNTGGALYSENSSINLINSLVYGNIANSNYAFANMVQSDTLNITNSTIFGNNSSNNIDININGTLNVTNCVFRVSISGTPTSVLNSCTLTDLSAYGTGNFTTAPQISTTGYLLAMSPCIDTGTSTGAPATDMDGISRPAGVGIDIGCYEYKDSDNDGISDGEEISYYKTDPLLADTDFDGINDGDEVNTHNTNPLLADTDSDGLSDGEEINNYNTNPLVADTDSDGLNDYEEINTHNTNPLLADTDSDGISDGDEVNNLTHPLYADTDSDGLGDSWETSHFGDLSQNASGDYDSNGLTNGEEFLLEQSFSTSTNLNLVVYTMDNK